MKCKCGYENGEGALLCARCGCILEQPKKKPRSKLPVLIAVGAVVLVVAALAFLLLRSSPAERVMEAIDAIGTVTMDSRDAILNAEEKYAALDSEAQAQVTNISTLEKARKEFDRQKKLIDNAAAAVDAIGEVTLDSEGTISMARSAYDKAESLDTTGILEDTKAALEAAEAEYERQLNDQDIILKEGLEAIDDAVSLILTGNPEQANANLDYYMSRLTDTAKLQELATSIVEALCAEAQNQRSSNEWMAMHLLSQRTNYADYCDTTILADAVSLEDQITTDLSKNRPKNGAIIHRTYKAGMNSINMTAGAYDTCVKFELVSDPSKYAVIYIRGNESAKLYLQSGTYRIKYTTGSVWYGEDMQFGRDATYILLDDTIELKSYTTDNYIHWSVFTWTISSGYGDEWGYQNMDPSQF